jgi:hypothetical protein
MKEQHLLYAEYWKNLLLCALHYTVCTTHEVKLPCGGLRVKCCLTAQLPNAVSNVMFFTYMYISNHCASQQNFTILQVTSFGLSLNINGHARKRIPFMWD